MSRLRYVALLGFALFAIIVGLFPSILTAGAILALPIAAIALIGLVSPNVIAQRPWLRIISAAGLVVFGAEFLIVSGRLVATKRRPVAFVVDGLSPRKVRVVYGVVNGVSQPFSWERQVIVPPNNIAFVRYRNNGDWWNSADNPNPIRVTVNSATGGVPQIVGSWVSGGYTQSGSCHFEYDEYNIGGPPSGDVPRVTGSPPAGWLDSLDTWGVECRDGRLFRSPAGTPTNVRRTGSPCYRLIDGSVSCFTDAVTNKSRADTP